MNNEIDIVVEVIKAMIIMGWLLPIFGVSILIYQLKPVKKFFKKIGEE